jgi:hypothetical protein
MKDKQIDGNRGCFFHGLYSRLEGNNYRPAQDLTYEEAIIASDTRLSSRMGVKVVDVSLTFEDGDTYMDFDA